MSKTYESIYRYEDGHEIIIARGSKDYVENVAQMSQFVPYTIREFQTPENIRADYRDWRNENRYQKPNRVIVKMHWEDEPERQLVDTIGIEPQNYWFKHDNGAILFWVSTIPGLIDLMRPGNGCNFVVDEVLEFYKA